jgi:hypothetical protein
MAWRPSERASTNAGNHVITIAAGPIADTPSAPAVMGVRYGPPQCRRGHSIPSPIVRPRGLHPAGWAADMWLFLRLANVRAIVATRDIGDNDGQPGTCYFSP